MLSSRLLSRSLHVGQKIPSVQVFLVHKKENHYDFERRSTDEIFKGKKVVMVGFPGAFTPVCTSTHLPEFAKLYDQFRAKGAEVLPISVNDAFVMKAFAEKIHANMPFIADPDALLTKALDSGYDLSDKGLGFRSRRFSIIVEDGVVKEVNDENSTDMTEVSRADTVLKSL